MRYSYQSALALVVLNFVLVANCLSQEDTTHKRLTKLILSGGTEVIGTIVGEDSISIHFNAIGNISMTIPKKQVKAREKLSGRIIGGQYIRPDPNQTRLFFSQSGRPLRYGQGYFSVTQIFFPLLAVGLTDFFSMAGGISIFPTFEDQLFYIIPKLCPINTDNFSLSAGAYYFNSISMNSDGLGLIYTVSTFGSQNTSLTAGIGWGILDENIESKPILMLGGEVRASNSIKIISENSYPFGSDIALTSLGVRFFGERLAADFGLIYPVGLKSPIGIPFFPFLGFTYNFGAAK